MSTYLRAHIKLESSDVIDEISKWPEPARICSIQNLWRGYAESRYGTFMGFNALPGVTNKQAKIGTSQEWWKQIPITAEDANVFYFQHLKSRNYLCFSVSGSRQIEMYTDRELTEKKTTRIKCVRSDINEEDKRFVYDKNKTNSTFHWRNKDNQNHISFSGVGVVFYDRSNTNDLVPWLMQYTDDGQLGTERLQQQQRSMVQQWLNKMALSDYYDNFVQNGFDRMETILDMSETQLGEIGIQKIGHIQLLKKRIDSMRQDAIREYVQCLELKDL